MRTQRIGSKTERNGTMTAMTINEGTRDNNRELSDVQVKQGEKGFGIVEALLVFAICDGVFSVTCAVAGILGVIFDWFD
jgi:hypothetical protein